MTKHIFPYQLCIFLFCWLTCMTTAVRAEGDVLNRIVYLSKSKGTVYVLLGMVSERTDFLFIYDSKVVDNERLVKIEKGSRTLRQAITEIVGIQDLELRVVGNHILINAPVKREYPMEQVVDTLAHFVLEGTLLDKKNGVPIVYATVGVEGTSIGSITNQAGEFRLHLADSLRRKSLVFSHVGYVAQKIDIPLLTAGQHFTLTLEPRIFPLQEVVIRVVHPIRLMREMLEKRMINYSQKPVYFTTFYREGVQYKQKFRSLTEAVFKIYKSPVQSLYAREQVKLLKMSRITDGLEQDTLIARMSGGIDACLQLYIINHLNKIAGEKNLYAETGYTLFAIIIAVIFIVAIGITVFNVKEESTIGVYAEKTSLKQAFRIIIKNDQLLAFIGILLTFNLCTQIAKSFAVYYFKCVCHDEYLYSIFGFAIIAEMAGLLCFPKIAEKISREKVYAFACGLPIVGFVLLGAAGYVAPQSKVLVIVCCALLFFGSGLSLGVTTCCMADVIDYGEVKFGVRNESVTCSAQTFLMKAAMAAAGGLTGIGLQIVGYNAKAVTQSTATVMGIRVLMIVIPIILAFASFGIYKKYYILKGEKMEEITRKVNEMHAKKQTA